MIKKLLLIVVAVSILLSCRSLEWKKVKEQNSVYSYETFLKKYPTGRFSVEAREALHTLAWENARKEGSIEAYQDFIQKYPESEFRGVAKRLMDERGLKNAEKKNTLEAYQDFIRKNPESRNLNRVKRKMEELSWEKAQKKDSVKGYQKFIESSKNSFYTAKADDRKKKLGLREFEVVSFKEAEKENTLDSYRVFLEIYPRGLYADKAIQLMIPLLPGTMGKRVKDLISGNPLAKARGIISLKNHETDELLLITSVLINTLDNKTPLHPKGRVWEKSSTIGGEVKKLFHGMGKKALPSLSFAVLLGGYLNSRYSDEVRVEIVQTLKMIGDPEAVGPLTDLLEIEDVDYRVKLEAISALLTVFKDPYAKELSSALLTRFLNHSDESIRWQTVLKLAEINNPGIVAPLISTLNDKVQRLHVEKIRVLGATGDTRAVNPLISILTTGNNSDAQLMAAEGLVSIGDRRAIKPFTILLKSKVRPSLRRKAIKGLVKLYTPETDELLTSELTLLSNDPDQFIRIKAREALSRAGLIQPPTREN